MPPRLPQMRLIGMKLSLQLKTQIAQIKKYISTFSHDIFKKDFIIGLDIGTNSIKIAQFRKLEDGLHLVKADLKEIEAKDDAILYEKEIVSILQDLFSGIDIKKSKIIVSINCPKTTIKIAQISYMPKSELREGIRLEAKNYFPFPIEDSLLDYEILGDIVEEGVRKYEVVVAVSPRKTIDKYLSLLAKAAIKPASFVPCSYALQKLAKNFYAREGKTTCFMDIGKLYTELVIFKGRDLMFFRKIPVAGRDFTQVMTRVLVSERGRTELTIDEAEKIKREIGIPPGEAESKIIDNKISTNQIVSMLRTPLEQLVSEIERCFDYYREETTGTKIDLLLLWGGGASLAGLAKFLSEGLGIEVELGEPIHQGDKISYRLGLAIGAALSERRGINLLPPEIKEETKRVVRRGTLEAIVTAAILTSVLVYIGIKIQLNNFQKRISAGRMELFSLQPQLKKVRVYHLANMILVDEPYWEDVFKELSNLMPGNIYLTNMSMKDNVITMRGVVAQEGGERFLSDFILTLEKGIFKNVKLVKTKELEGRLGNEFELRCWVDND